MKRETIFEGKMLRLYRLENGYEIVEHQAAVCVLVLDGERVLGVRQKRPAIARETWEIPAGLVDEGEDPLESARRELAEEVQLQGKLTLITQAYTSPGYCDEKIYIYEATALSPAAAEPEAEEDLKVEWRDLKETWRAIREGELATSAPTALALAYALGRSGKL